MTPSASLSALWSASSLTGTDEVARIRLSSSGRSRFGRWPQPSRISARPFGEAAASACPTSGGISGSASPPTTSSGSPLVTASRRIGPVADRRRPRGPGRPAAARRRSGAPPRPLRPDVPGAKKFFAAACQRPSPPSLLRDPDPFLAERRALGRVGVRARADEHEPREALGCEPRDRARGVAAHRRADRDEPAGHRLEHSQRPVVEARAEPVERRRRASRDRRTPRSGAPTSGRRTAARAGRRSSSRQCGDDIELGGDRGPLGQLAQPFLERRVRRQVEAEHVPKADQPRRVGDVGEPVLERPFDESCAPSPRGSARATPRPVLAAPERVVRVAEVGVEAVDRAAGRAPGRPDRRAAAPARGSAPRGTP